MKSDDIFWKEFKIGIKEELVKELRETLKIKNFNNRRQIGSILHDFYNCCERIFKKISIDINGGFELKSDRLDRLVDKFNRVSKEFNSEISDFLKMMVN